MTKLILVGRVAGAFGVKGELRLTAYTETPASLLRYRVLRDDAGAPFLTLDSGHESKGALLARAREVVTRDEAEALRGRPFYIERDALPAPDEEDEFYLSDLVGAQVVSDDGEPVGNVKFVANFGAGDLLEIEPAEGGASFYIPFTKDNVPFIDLANNLVTVKSLTALTETLPDGAESQT